MAISDVTFRDDVKHPYLLALVRWCVQSFWSAASVLLQRLLTSRLPPLTAARSRPASYDHLHPEPRVDCRVLHAPPHHALDVVFVHGLYGSLGNTWRQGEWRTEYDKQPEKIPLRRPHSIPSCRCTDELAKCCNDSTNVNIFNQESHKTCARSDETSRDGDDIAALGDKNDECRTGTVVSDKKYEMNEAYADTDFRIGDKNNESLHDNPKVNAHYRIENDKKIVSQKISKDKGMQKNVCNIANDHRLNDNNFNCNILNNRNDKFYEKIKKLDVQIPSSNRKDFVSDQNVQNDYTACLNEKINAFEDNIIYDNIEELNIQNSYNNVSEQGLMNAELNSNIYDGIQKILPTENLFITEKFYNNTLLDDVDIGSYETQAQFVKDLFENSVKVKSDANVKSESENDGDVKASDCQCEVKCEPGCGCVCDDCYSPCWPRDWIREDYPGARVISVNYTSDPYLWRPLWIKESKRLRLHERAEQMMSQLLELGVGEKPIIWVGHSKGGLFIKKMYCESYEAHLKLTKKCTTNEDNSENVNEQNTIESRNDNEINHCRDKKEDAFVEDNINEHNKSNDHLVDIVKNDKYLNVINGRINETIEGMGYDNANKEIVVNYDKDTLVDTRIKNEKQSNDGEAYINNKCDTNGNIPEVANVEEKESLLHEDAALARRAALWRRSAGFMFYSVPHRGSPLADIKTPITARSVELMEICKDCPLVLALQESWARAAQPAPPRVRSVVETRRTLMSVLYLRIVSVDSADPGIGSLCGVGVDHRQICKPTSRRCALYQELMTLMEAALAGD